MISLLELLIHTSGRLIASEPLDKVFALFGIASDGTDPSYTVDYGISERQLYLKLARNFIATLRRLDVLSLCSGDWQLGPSWVPYWSYATRNSAIAYPEDRGIRFSAYGDFPEIVRRINPSPNPVLRVYGRMFGHVWSTKPESIKSPPHSNQPGVLLEALELAERLLPYSTGDTAKEVCLQTIKLSSMGYMGTCQAFWDEVESKKSKFDGLIKTSKVPTPVIQEQGSPSKDIVGYQRDIARKLFVTRNRYLGLAPWVHEGDYVCCLAGGMLPYTLRKAHSDLGVEGVQWNVLGDCYVHGLMRGESMTGLKEKALQVFELV